jgi:pilus assembly protein Flp/PilA
MNSNLSRAQGIIEYALILVLITMVVIVVLAIFGTAIGDAFSNIINSI